MQGGRQRATRKHSAQNHHDADTSTNRKRAVKVKTQVQKGAHGKATRCFWPEIAKLSAEERHELTQSLHSKPTDKAMLVATANVPAGYTVSDVRRTSCAKASVGLRRQRTQRVRPERLCAPGPSGARGEHAEECMKLKHSQLVRRWHAALDAITAQSMMGTLTEHTKWILDAQVTFLFKQKADPMEVDNDSDWIALLRRANLEEVGGTALARARLDETESDEYGADPSDTDSDDTNGAQTDDGGRTRVKRRRGRDRQPYGRGPRRATSSTHKPTQP